MRQTWPAAVLLDRLLAAPQYLLPHHLLSRLMLRATRSPKRWWKNTLIHWFTRHFGVDMSEVQERDPLAYTSFNAFFTRALRPDARPLPKAQDAIISPVDGTVSQVGRIQGEQILQAKGHEFTLSELLGGDTTQARPFHAGHFVTLYLSPRDYHRIHMPFSGQLRDATYIPGRLFSVAPYTVRSVSGLFARNERLAVRFITDAGPMAMILVGALFVGCIETVWAGVVTPPHRHWVRVQRFDTPNSARIHLQRGEEMGRFNMGSTVILLFGPNAVAWHDELRPGAHLRMGQVIGRVLPCGE
jgi:phosphatidylserine decarboxylase